MRLNNVIAVVSLLFLLASSHYSYAISASAKTMVNFETKANAVAVRNNNSVSIPHFEIPLSMLEIDFAERFAPEYRSHLIFERNGVKYLRWILNPEDTKWHLEVASYFKSKGLKLEKRYYFTGYQTASRSYIVEDPRQEVQFSVKSSTDKTGGYWADKKQYVGEAEDSRANADLLFQVQRKLKFEYAIIMDEPAIMKIPQINQAVVIRDLADLNNPGSGKIYVPGFSVLHEETGRKIAAKNGSNDPYKFWTEHYVKATARALAELAARTGMQFDSPHSQNFLVELDSQYRPTGRIVLRDLADIYLYRKFSNVVHPEAKKYVDKYTQRGNILDHIAAGFGPLHGNTAPSWIRDREYQAWKDIFFAQFEKTFSEISGLPIEIFKAHDGAINGMYFANDYRINRGPTEVASFWENIHRYQSPRGILNCSNLFAIR